VASADIAPFYAMASRKQKGAKMSIKLIKNADTVANICADVVGEVCSIMSGAAGIIIAFRAYEMMSAENSFAQIAVTVAVGALIAAVTVGSKAATKRYARNNAQKIVGRLGRFLSIFSRNK
jgi:CBS domain containing-hemolysin-like protein